MTTTRGFTLIETMVAITVLALALVGPFVAARSALQASYNARDQLIASSLAQEALEYIRNVRDNNYLASPRRDWMSGLSSLPCYGVDPARYCTVDATEGDVHDPGNNAIASYDAISPNSCSTGARCLYLSDTNLYNQQLSGEQTRFKRVVQLRVLDASEPNEVEITVQVFWKTGVDQYSVTVKDVIRDWL